MERKLEYVLVALMAFYWASLMDARLLGHMLDLLGREEYK